MAISLLLLTSNIHIYILFSFHLSYHLAYFGLKEHLKKGYPTLTKSLLKAEHFFISYPEPPTSLTQLLL